MAKYIVSIYSVNRASHLKSKNSSQQRANETQMDTQKTGFGETEKEKCIGATLLESCFSDIRDQPSHRKNI